MNYDEQLIIACKKIIAESNAYNLSDHLLAKHYSQTITKVTEKFPQNISLSKRIKAIAEDSLCTCRFCGTIHGKPDKDFCSHTCYLKWKSENATASSPENITRKQLEKQLKKFEGKEEGEDFVRCVVCGYIGADLGNHLKTHGLNSKSYHKQYGNDLPIKCERIIRSVSGENNPGYQHGGKLSVFSDNFLYADENKKQEAIKKTRQTKIENNTDSTTIGYWLERTDGNLEEAKKLLSERQSTFSLQKCIEKYGEEKGKQRWLDRQEKWIEAYNNKTEKEMEDINRKKSNLMSYSILWRNDANYPGILYILEIADGFYKIGITTRTIPERYRATKYKIIGEYAAQINQCFQIEQLIKKYFKKYSISKEEQIDEFGWTETFKLKSAEKLIEAIEKLHNSPKITLKLFKEEFNLKYEEKFI